MSAIDADGNEIKDGFRKPKKRPKGWLKQAIKDGSVRDPNAPDPDAGREKTGEVFDVPVMTLAVDGKEQ